MMPKIKHQQRFMRQAIWLTALVGTSVLCVQTASAEPQVILNPRAYTLSQPGEAPVTIPAVETIGSAAQFYDYYSASSHTGYERLGRSLMFLHRDVSQNPPPVSLIITHGIDYNTSGQRQPTAEVNMDITNLPAATVITQSDDGGELKKVNATTAEGRWWFRDNTDGGVIQGLPEDQDWDINIDVDFIQGLTEYEYFFANGQNITLDPTKSVTIGYDAPPTNATYSVEGYEGVPVTICATVVSNNNSTSSYVWTWETDAAPHTSTGSTGSDIETICNTYTYQEDGIYEVELEVTDGTGTSTVTTRVFINNTDPPGDNVDPLHDEFDGEWKSCLWDSYQRYGGDTYREGDPKYDPGLNTVRNDRLDLKVPANYLAGMDWETGLESTYMLGGNFDVQVDFHLPDAEYWTNLDMRGLNVLFVELMANDAGSRRRQVRNSRLNPDTNQAVFNPHLWVANASASKVTQIDTDNPTTNYGSVDNGILGQYNTGNNPSRTSVDLLGNVWINHRCDSSVWRIRASECTPPSCTVTEVNTGYKDEFNTAYSNGQCNGGGVAVDKNNDPWVGFLNDRVITKLDQSTGQVVLATSVPGRVYGVAVDVNDYIWVDQMWDSRISKVDALTGAKIADYRPNDGLCFSPYGIAVDAYGKIWNGMWGSCPYITRFDPVTETFERFQSPNGSADLHYNRGVAADNQGLVWTVSSYRDKLSVFNMDTGAFVASYNTCDSPSGVALDRNNRVWVTCMGGNGAVWMHDRDGTPLAQIQTGSTTYSYSDMTGYQLRNFGSDAWKESFTASQSVQEDAYFISSVENNYGGGIEDGVGGNESVDPTLAPVQNLSTTSANQYELNRIRFGELYYTDKLFRILGQPSDVEGLWGLRTPDNDRLRKDDVLVTLDATQELDAYIAYDAKANRLPSWLQNNYTMVDDDNDGNQDQVTTTNTRSPVYDLYKRRYNTGDQIVFGGNLARTSATGTVYASCKDIIARDPLAPSGTYTIDNGTSGPISVFCDMESDGGVGHTAIRIPVPTTSTNQNDYAAACNAIGMDIIVPRSKGHAEQLMAHFGEAPNVVNVKAVNVDGSTVDPYSRYSSFGFSGWIGHCRDEAGSPRDCSYYLSDYNDGDCDKASPNELNPFFPYVDGSHDKLLTRSTATNAPGCRMGEWYSNRQMYITGWVMCSPNDTYIEPAQSCADIAFAKSQHNTTQGISGTYTLTTQSGTTYEAYCDMHLEGGGWTQGIRQANNSTLFNYDSSYWTDGTLYNEGQVAPNNRDAKFQSFLSVPFDEIAVGMTQSYGATAESTISRDSYRYVTMPQSASSMLSLFQSPGEKLSNATLAGTSTTGRNAWKSLITDSSLQYNCNKQGANVGNNYARVRLGILGNNENNCGSPDSRLGVGGRGSACGQDNNNTSGNTATCSPDNGNRNHRAASTVMARKKYGKLIADWNFNGDLTDRSGNGHDARVRVTNRPWCTQAGPVYNTGVSAATQDQALEYDGCDDLIDVPSMATVNTDSVTLSMWLYLDSSKFARDANNNWISLLNKTFETSGATTGYDIVIEENGLVAFDTSHQGISGSHRWWTRKKVPFDEWAHLAVSYDNVTKTKYAWINGELIDTVNLPANYGGIKPNGVVLYIGSNPNTYPANGGGTIPGKLDNLKVYDGLIPQEAMESLAGSRASSRVSNYFAYFKPTIFSQAPPAISQYTIIEDPVKDAQDNDKDVLSTAGRLRITRTASIWSFFYADEVTDPTVWKRMGDPMDLGEQNTRIRVRTRLDPFWHSGPVNNPGGALSIQYDNYRVNSADEVIGAPIEVCNGLDDDCDGRIDENYVGKYEPCNTGLPGVCGDGYLVCENGGMVCKQINQPSVELCDNIDNDCNGIVDDFVDGGETASGDYVSTGESCSDDGATGPCQNGQYICEMGVMICKGVTPAEPEICDGIDNDCDGVVDNTSNHIFAELTQFLTAKQRTMPFIWPRPVIGTMPFFTDNGDPNDDFVRYDGANSDPALSTVYLTTTSSVHTLRKAKVIFYLDPTLADAQNPRGRYVLWLTHGRAEAAQGAANAAYAIKHTFDNPLDVIFNDSNESSIHAGNSSNSYQNFVVTSETASSGGVALGSLPSAENWTIELSATFDGDIDGWELYNPETGAHLELNPSQKLTLENQDLPGSTLLTADSGQPCAVPGAQGICEMGTGVCFDGNFICNQTVTPMPHELCDGLDNDCDGLADEASNIVYAKVEIRQDGHPDLDSWLWAPTIDNGISPEQSMNFQPEVSDDRVGSPDMRSVEDMMQSLQKLDASVLTFHLDQRKGQGTISMPLLHGAREENVTALVPAETRLELELERMSGGTLPKELFTSLYDDRTGAVADAAPSDYNPNKFTFNWTLERNSTSTARVMREADGIVVRDIAESYSFAGSSYQLKFKEMGNLDAWEFYRPYRVVITLDEDKPVEVRTSLVTESDALCVIQDHPLEKCLGTLSNYVCVDGQVTCQINPAGCCEDRDGDGYYGYDSVTCATGTDCDDDNELVNPAAQEICDGIDNDCNGFINGTQECSWLDSSCNVIDEEFPEAGDACEGPLDADCNEVGDGGYDCTRDAAGKCILDAEGKCDLFVVTSVGECSTSTVCLDGNLTCNNTGGPTEEVCDGLDNDCDGEVDASYYSKDNTPDAPEYCLDGKRCGPRECDYQDVCGCEPGKIGVEACECRAALEFSQGTNPCTGNTYFDGTQCVAVCTEDNDCEDGFVCDMTTRACVKPAPKASQDATSPRGCSSAKAPATPTGGFLLGSLLLLGGLCSSRRRRKK